MTAALRVAAVVALACLWAAPAAPAQPPIVRPPEAPRSTLELGRQLFAANCARCHGPEGGGDLGRVGEGQADPLGPSLVGVGRLSADFYLRTGYMPLESSDQQPERSRVRFTDREIVAMVEYVASLGEGPDIPEPHPERASVAAGQRAFAENCAGCHQMAGEGGVVTGARVPPLDRADAVQIAQAVRIGPYLMPAFPESAISEEELDSIVAYVLYTQEPQDPGGWGIGHLGPFPEGMVTWGIAGLAVIGFCMLLGERVRRR